MTAVTAAPLSARAFMFGDREDAVDRAARALEENGWHDALRAGTRNLSGAARDAVGNEVGGVAQRLLDADLGASLLSGWSKHTDLLEAARRTRNTPGSREILDLAKHAVTARHQLDVDLLAGELTVARVRFELTLTFEVRALVAVVSDGRLVAIAGGSCIVAAELAVEGQPLMSHRDSIQVPLVVRLGSGVALLPDTGRGASATPPR